jgi:hypothetical protein
MKNWVVGVTNHPKYNGRAKSFDFALLELESGSRVWSPSQLPNKP